MDHRAGTAQLYSLLLVPPAQSAAMNERVCVWVLLSQFSQHMQKEAAPDYPS